MAFCIYPKLSLGFKSFIVIYLDFYNVENFIPTGTRKHKRDSYVSATFEMF
jgi:hypothetical protein